jgi:hypothetical protein
MLVLTLLLAVFPEPVRAIKVEKLTGALAVAAGAPEGLEVVAERLMVRFSSGVTKAQREASLAGLGARILREYEDIGWTFVALPDGMRVADGLGLARGLPGVAAVEPDHVYRPNLLPNDPLAATQWALNQVNAAAGWEFEVGSSCRTTIAIIDTGVDVTHNDLSGKMGGALQHRFCDPTAPAVLCANEAPQAACNHATRVAGVAAASTDNSLKIAGMSWGAQILSLRAFRTTDCNSDCSDKNFPFNTCATDDAGVIEGLKYVVDRNNVEAYGRMVVNMSLGAAGACSAAMATQLAATVAAGIPVTIAAGNNGGAVNQPANCSAAADVIGAGGGVIPVGATDETGVVASFSSRGAELASYGVVAPGVSVLTTDLSNGTINATGTSFSSPHVAGLAALILSAKPAEDAAYVQNTIRSGANVIGTASLGMSPLGTVSGAGLMNAFRSMRLAVKGTLADFEGDQKAIAFPNPFRVSQNPLVSITVPTSLQGANTKIKLYTISGEFVKELTGLTWDGKNKDGNLVATGTYVFVVSTDNGSTRGRVAVIR